jgi:hypothetical protein
MRQFTASRLLVATHNKGKLAEIEALLAPFGIACTGAAEMNLPEPPETETSFIGNARIKAHAAARATGLPALADDSGIECDRLGRNPAGPRLPHGDAPDLGGAGCRRRPFPPHGAVPLDPGAGLARRP